MRWLLNDGAPCTAHNETLPAEKGRILTELKGMQSAASIVLWNVNGVFWGRWDGENLSFLEDGVELHADFLTEFRAFNEKEELHLTNRGETFLKRYVLDTGDTAYIDSVAPLWGNKIIDRGTFVELKDAERRLTMKVPLALGDMTAKPKFIGLATRSYIGMLPTGQAGFVDIRFLKLTPMKGGDRDV